MLARTILLALVLLLGCQEQKPPEAPPAPKPSSQEPRTDIIKIPFADEVRAAAEFYFGVPAPVPVILAQIQQESGFNPLAKSQAGAMGLMQFMPATAEWAAKAGGFGISTPMDPKWSIRAGTWYDRWLYDRVQKADTKCDRWLFALSGYNGGEGWVRKRQALSQSPGSWMMTGNLNPGIKPESQRENFGYGPRIIYNLQPRYEHLGPLVCKGGE